LASGFCVHEIITSSHRPINAETGEVTWPSLATSSWKCRQELASDIVPVEDFNVGNLSLDYVDEQHSFGCIQVQATMARTIVSFGFWLGIERRTEVISTPATVCNCQLRNLCCQFGLALVGEKLFEFTG
jgi:hypothetical protein